MSLDVDRRRWHIDRSVNFSHILATLSLLAGLAYQYATFSARLAVLGNTQSTVAVQLTTLLSNQQRVDNGQDAELADIKRDIRETYRSIDTKIDTLIASREPHGRR